MLFGNTLIFIFLFKSVSIDTNLFNFLFKIVWWSQHSHPNGTNGLFHPNVGGAGSKIGVEEVIALIILYTTFITIK